MKNEEQQPSHFFFFKDKRVDPENAIFPFLLRTFFFPDFWEK